VTSPWAENTYEVASEVTSSEGPYGESYYPAGESEWGSPFAPAEAEQGSLEYGQEYGQEALSPDGTEIPGEWESPFTTSGYAADSEIMRTPDEFPKSCGDTTFTGKPWPHGLQKKRKPEVGGRASDMQFVPRAEVFEFQLSDYDVDRHELKPPHKQRIEELARRVLAGIREQRYSGEPIRVYTYGEASSTASHIHNLELSHNRAYNCLFAIKCEFQKAGITQPVTYGFYGTGEVHARVRGPNQKEDPQFRGVIVRVFAPLKDCKGCEKPPTTYTSSLCVSVPRIAPRVAMKLPPDIIPLGSIVPGLRLPFAIVTRAQATVRVDEQRSRKTGQYTFQGWGLEVALPAGRTRVDLQADLRASLEVLVRASASLGVKLRLGPLKLSLRVDVSVFAQLIVKLCAQLRLHIDANLGRPNIPELPACRIVGAPGARGPEFPFGALAGPAVLIVPGAGYGPGIVHFGGPGVAGLQLSVNPIPVPADKSTVKTLLALGGNLQLASAGGREAEYEQPEAEWPEAFAELESELAPFV
jgi:hypothetical protein